jgi:hypothetical protein
MKIIEIKLTTLYSFLRPSWASNSAKIPRNWKDSPKNIVAWHRPESWEHSNSQSEYLTRSLHTFHIYTSHSTSRINFGTYNIYFTVQVVPDVKKLNKGLIITVISLMSM